MNKIPILNVYYMLSYAFRSIHANGVSRIEPESFHHIHDLLAAIIAQGVAHQIRCGLCRDYIPQQSELYGLRGQILLSQSLKQQSLVHGRLVCAFDEVTSDSSFNRILKCTMLLLLTKGELQPERRDALRRQLFHFSSIQDVDPSEIRFSTLGFHRNNASYRLLLGACRLVLQGLLLTTREGTHQLASWIQEESMHRLYERFLLSYYQHHHRSYSPQSTFLAWDTEHIGPAYAYLPRMEPDILMKNGSKKLIVDAKYYSRTMATQYDRQKYHAENLYQIYSYVKNLDCRRTGCVSGILLYAKTDEALVPDATFCMGGNLIRLLTLDLCCHWSQITSQLDALTDFLTEASPQHDL